MNNDCYCMYTMIQISLAIIVWKLVAQAQTWAILTELVFLCRLCSVLLSSDVAYPILLV